MEKWKKRSIELVTSLLFGGRERMTVVPYYPQKTVVNQKEERFFRRTVPEKKGLSSRRIYNMMCELESERRAGVHSLLVLCDGEIICECSADGYNTNEWHVSHSMSKTVCGMVIGKLVDRDRLSLDMPIKNIFPEIPYKDKKFPLITVEHLLAMTSGVDFAEAGAITEQNWTSAFFASTVRFSPGSKFAYNSMNSYILARIAEKVTGRSFGSLAEEFIFAPLGIKNFMWEIGPEGTEKGGWGLYMSAESWAKVGYMLMCGGVFLEKRILSEEWVKSSSTVKAITPQSTGNFNYAYHMWTGRDNGEILFNGMLGQNVWICPKNKIVAVITSGNNEFFQESPALEIIRKYLGGDMNDEIDQKGIKLLENKQSTFFYLRRWVHPKERNKGLLFLLGIRSNTPFDSSWYDILGSYAIVNNNSSIMPLILRVMQNNLDTFIEKISLYRYGDDLMLCVTEGGEELRIKVGFYGYKESVMQFGEEKYIIRAMGEASQDLYGNPEYKIELILPETANTRMIVIRKKKEGWLDFELNERPGYRLAENVLFKYRQSNGVISFASEMLERRIGERELERMIKRAFNPLLTGISTDTRDYKYFLEKEKSAIMQGESSAIKIIRSIVDRFFKDENE